MQASRDLLVRRVGAQREVGGQHRRAAVLLRVVGVRHRLLGVLGDPLVRTCGALGQLPLMPEEVLEETVAPLCRQSGTTAGRGTGPPVHRREAFNRIRSGSVERSGPRRRGRASDARGRNGQHKCAGTEGYEALDDVQDIRTQGPVIGAGHGDVFDGHRDACGPDATCHPASVAVPDPRSLGWLAPLIPHSVETGAAPGGRCTSRADHANRSTILTTCSLTWSSPFAKRAQRFKQFLETRCGRSGPTYPPCWEAHGHALQTQRQSISANQGEYAPDEQQRRAPGNQWGGAYATNSSAA